MIRLLLCLILIALPARAEMPAGHDDPRFQAAVAAWLDADDQASLPAFAALAREGNTAAQILLARIDMQRTHPGPWLKTLSQEELRTLFRKPNGKFPKSWLAVAADKSVLAAALQDSRFKDRDRRTLAKLIALGETRIAAQLASRLMNFAEYDAVIEAIHGRTNDPQLMEIASVAALYSASEQARMLRELKLNATTMGALQLLLPSMLERLGIAEGEIDQQAMVEIAWAVSGRLPEGHGDRVIRNAFLESITRIPEGAALARLCKKACQQSFGSCFSMGMFVAGGLSGLDKVGSPVQSLIPQKLYMASARAPEDTLNAMAGMAHALPGLVDSRQGAQRHDRCLAAQISERLK
ncbi:MAG: hypothetical protein AAGH68_07305 [Pseudomonadota bacterium]